MKMGKLAILMIAVVAIGFFALPASLSVGTGQHKFRQANSLDTDLVTFCGQCHGATDTIFPNEINQSDHNVLYGTRDVTRIHSSLFGPGQAGCASCHEITGGYSRADPANPAKVEHAAKIPSCLKCHAAGTDLITVDVLVELNATTEAHRNFKNIPGDAQNDIYCIGCHTYVDKRGAIEYSYEPGVMFRGLSIGNGTTLNP